MRATKRPNSVRLVAGALVWLAVCGLTFAGYGDEPAPADLGVADAEFDEHNYARAMQSYENWLDAQPDPTTEQAVDVLVKLTQCRMWIGHYDDALAGMRELLDEDGLGPLQRARLEAQLGVHSQALPGGAYLRDGGVSYDPGEYEGEYVWRYPENIRDAFVHLERGKLILDGALRDQQAGALATDADVAARVIEADLELARMLQTVSPYDQGLEPRDHPAADLPEGATYDPRWPLWSKVMFLYDEVEALADAKGDGAHAAEAVYRTALFLEGSGWLREGFEWEKERTAPALPVPAVDEDDADAMAELERLLAEYPAAPEHDLHAFTHAQFLIDRGEFVAAERELEAFLAATPDSAWAEDARNALQDIRYPRLAVTSVAVVPPGGGTTLPVSARNLDEVAFAAWSVDLLAVLGNGARLRNPDVSFEDFERNFGKIDAVRKHYLAQAARWTLPVPDTGDHSYHELETTLPLSEPGAYVVEATGGKHDAAFLVIVSDVTAIVRQDEGSALLFVVDAQSGEPLPDFPLIVKETYWDSSAGRWGKYRSRVARGFTDEDGTYRHELVTGVTISSNTVAALVIEGEHIAVTPGMWVMPAYYGDEYDQAKVFASTDRPVYRPGQTVQFKHLVRTMVGGIYQNVPGKKVRVKIHGPQGDEVYAEQLTTSEYGSVHGSWEIEDEEPPLGVYSMTVELLDRDLSTYVSAGSQFRVEEYRKPEFEVTVEAAEVESRPGAEIPVEVRATYFFGAPVSEAKVRYTVFRTPYHHAFSYPGAYDWLYGPGYGLVHERPFTYQGEEYVEDGTLTTDADGVAKLTLRAADDEDQDYRYRVQVEVQDLARRTIHGTGGITVTRQPFFAAVDADRGFYSPGDAIELEVRAETPGGVPVAAEGALRTYRLVYEEGHDVREVLIREEPYVLDEHGHRFTEMVPDEAGAYRVRFSAPAGEGLGEVEAQRDLWVYDETFPGQRIRFANLELVTDRRHYEKGETLRLMIQSPFVSPTVLLSVDGAEELIDHQVVSIEGRSTVVEIPLGDAHVPNFFVRAAMAHDYQVFFRDREIFVPPADRFLDVVVEADRDDYRPGQEGTFAITVRDHAGQPVQGEFQLAAVDKALYYIQEETTGDIRAYFYGDRRYSDVDLVHSRSYHAYALSRDRNRWTYHEVRGIPYYYGWGGYYGGFYDYDSGGVGGGGISFGGLMMESEAVSRTVAPAPASKPAEGRYREPAGDKLARMDTTTAMPTTAMRSGGDLGILDLPNRGPEVEVRTEFADTAHWEPVVVTGADGTAEVVVTWPDTLTTWDVVVRGADGETRVGGARIDALTTKELLVRLQTPRFLVEQDRLLVSALVTNRGLEDRVAAVTLDVPDELVRADGALTAEVEVPAGGQARADFEVEVLRPGDATFTATAVAGDEGDAVRRTVPVLTWGAEKQLTESAVIRDGGDAALTFDVPARRREETTLLTVQLNPSLASVMLDAVPYLIDYPYGCVEQTMSRFMPAALTAKTMRDLGVDFADIRAASRQPGLLGEDPEQLAAWHDDHPVFHQRKLDAVVRRSLGRLYAFQHLDGGWGWWKDGDSDPYMSAYVVAGMQVAEDAGYAVDGAALDRGYQYLLRQWKQQHRKAAEDDWSPWWGHTEVYLAYVLSGRQLLAPADLDVAYDNRDQLSTYGKALLALALHRLGDAERAAVVVDNLRDRARVDELEGSASFDYEGTGGWWWWYEDRVETNAWALRAFLAVAPDDELADGLMKWLVVNRRGNRWHSTKDTAQAIQALAEYVTVRDELNPDYGMTVRLNGEEIHETQVTAKNLFRTKTQLVLPAEAIRSGENTLEVVTAGKGALYVTGYLTYFTKEKKIRGDGHHIHVEREYTRLTPRAGGEDLRRDGTPGLVYDREPIRDGGRVESGDLIEVKITVESDNTFEYLMFEDYKPAGFEPEEVKSGYLYDNGTWFNMELRDEKVAFFLDRLRQGRQVLDYQLRAETPGTFRVLPHRGQAMYAPRVRSISDSYELTIIDGP